MVEQGTKIYSAIFKRIWRSMREEFKKLYILNSIYLPVKTSYGESGAFALREDYLGDPSVVVPVADPHIASEQERMNQVMILKNAAHTTPGYDLQAVEHRFLRALHVDGIAQIYPGPDKVPPLPNPKMQVEQAKLEGKKLDLQAKQMQFVQKLEEEKKLNDAKIVELHARAAKELEEAGAAHAGSQVAAFEAAIEARKSYSESLDRQRKLTLEEMKHESEQRNAQAGGGSGMAPAPGNQGDV
jgi:chaperonin GroES